VSCTSLIGRIDHTACCGSADLHCGGGRS
jgi:hypothetical protein